VGVEASGQRSEFPFGLKPGFDRHRPSGNSTSSRQLPDPDMLPEGSLHTAPRLEGPRQSRYTQDEQRTEFTLWAISRSPLIMGGNLTKMDDFTRGLMTSRRIIEMDQLFNAMTRTIQP